MTEGKWGKEVWGESIGLAIKHDFGAMYYNEEE